MAIFFTIHVTNNKEGFIYEKSHSIDKSLYQEVSSSSSLRSPMDRSFGKGIVFCEFRLQFIWKTKLMTSESTFRMRLCECDCIKGAEVIYRNLRCFPNAT